MLPILYSFRRCPFAIRARMALCGASITVELREVSLRAKPDAMLALSSKGTVPVLQLPDQTILDESLDIMNWALTKSDPEQWLNAALAAQSTRLIHENDSSFKTNLDHYKYWERYPAESKQHYRVAGEVFLHRLETLLQEHSYLLGDRIGVTDVAIFPFIRQFAFVDKAWFDQAPYPRLQGWLCTFLDSTLFAVAMGKQQVWQMGDPVLLFP